MISFLKKCSFSAGTRKIFIPEAFLEELNSRSSGPGGQNVNKVNTKVELRFCVGAAHWLPEDVKIRLRQLRPQNITKDD